MTTWTVGEGRSSPQTMTAARMAEEDEKRSAWLAEKLKPRFVFKRRGDLCKRGHLLDGVKHDRGREVRYCRVCHAAGEKARRSG